MNKISYSVPFLSKGWSSILSLTLIGMLTACGGGGGGGGDPVPNIVDAVPNGYYGNTGTASVFEEDNNTAVTIRDLQGMIYNNRFTMLSHNRQLSYDGTITVSGNNYTGTVTIFFNGARLSTATVNGTIIQGSTVTGTLTGAGAGRGTFALNYSPKNSEPADLSIAGRVWTRPVGNSTTVFQFSVDPVTGQMTTSTATTNGTFQDCTFGSGSTMAPISGHHLYTVTMTLTGCFNTALNTAYTGLATTETVQDDKLPFVASNPNHSMHTNF